jgi:hypothetical protein
MRSVNPTSEAPVCSAMRVSGSNVEPARAALKFSEPGIPAQRYPPCPERSSSRVFDALTLNPANHPQREDDPRRAPEQVYVQSGASGRGPGTASQQGAWWQQDGQYLVRVSSSNWFVLGPFVMKG